MSVSRPDQQPFTQRAVKELKCEIAELLAKMRNLSLQAATESGTWKVATLSPIHEWGSGKAPGTADQ